ncbi:MAG TPA: hypothetical protein VMS11_06695 [Solirubrobacterales bacterium]|nr:hypothetical protein [Solirubrobacterales bacterium]
MRRTRRSLALRHPYEAALRERLERPLTESAQTSHGPTAAGNNDLAPALYSLEVLAETVVQLTNSDFALGLM